ncbi:MAG: hypothetical protein U0324_20405 [Polyangiales bacterium]
MEGGATTLDNLVACVSCSLRKRPRRAAIDPGTGVEAALYDPRSQRWDEHLRLAEDGLLEASPRQAAPPCS